MQLEQQVPLVRQVLRVLKVLQDLLVLRVPQVPLDLQVQQGLLGQQVRLVQQEPQEQAQRRFPTS